MTSVTDRSSITSILDRAQRDHALDILDFSDYLPRRAKDGGDSEEESSTKEANLDAPLVGSFPVGAVSQLDFELMTKAVNAACAMLKELGQRNEEIASTAESTIASLKTQLAVEKDRSSKLQRELDAARADKDRLANESQSRIKQLEGLNATLTEKLEEVTRELESAKPWLEYLSSQIHSELQLAVSQAERILSTPVSLPN